MDIWLSMLQAKGLEMERPSGYLIAKLDAYQRDKEWRATLELASLKWRFGV